MYRAITGLVIFAICVVFIATLVIFFPIGLVIIAGIVAVVIVIVVVTAPREHSLSKNQIEALRLLDDVGITLGEASPYLTKETANADPEKLKTHIIVELMK